MIKYAIYHPTTGEITQWGETTVEIPEDVRYVEHDIFGPLTDYYVDLVARAAVPKLEMALTYPTTPTEADGVTEAVIDGLPVGTVCEFFVNNELQRLVVSDGNLEIALVDPATIRVTFWHPIYRHDPVELIFI